MAYERNLGMKLGSIYVVYDYLIYPYIQPNQPCFVHVSWLGWVGW